MASYVLERLGLAAVTLVALSLIIFVLLRAVPGDPAAILLGDSHAGAEQQAELRRELGIDEPIYEQYASWLAKAFRGDLGESIFSGRPVADEVWTRLPVTLELLLVSVIVAAIIGIPVGVISAIRQDGFLDQSLRFVSLLGLTVPNFWIGTMVMVFGARWFGWIPPIGYKGILDDPDHNLAQFAVPGLIVALSLGASLTRITRSSVLEVIREDYVRTAWAKGLRERQVVLRHVLRNALIPVITVFAIQVGALIAGIVIIENIFSLPGLGRLVIDAINRRDYPLVQGIVMVVGAAVIFINLATDVAYGWLDPRIKYGGKR